MSDTSSSLCFSIVIPVYNRENLIDTTVESVLSQSYPHFELILVNDGSKDNSLEKLREWASKDQRISFVDQQNTGRCQARNAGIQAAKYDWVCFLDSDDVYHSNHLAELTRLIEKFPKQFAFATEQLVGGKKRVYPEARFNESESRISLADFIKGNILQINQFCYNLKEVPVLFPDHRVEHSEDWLFFRQVCLKTDILKSATITNELVEHTDRSVNQDKIEEIARWNHYTGHYFIDNNDLAQDVKQQIACHTDLLCANMLLSAGKKKEAKEYLKGLDRSAPYLRNSLYWKALIKIMVR